MSEFTQEEVGQILQAGLEKTAYEQGMAEYTDALEKVATVHDVDAGALHDFLEKEAAPGINQKTNDPRGAAERYGKKIKKWKDPQAGLGEKIKSLAGHGKDKAVNFAKENPAKAGLAGAGTVGALAGAGYGAKKMLDKKKKKDQDKDKEKEAAAFGLDAETYDFLLEQGVDALTE